jgi:hypothetical protein
MQSELLAIRRANLPGDAPAPAPSVAKAVRSTGLRFVARQPILTKDEKSLGTNYCSCDGTIRRRVAVEYQAQ